MAKIDSSLVADLPLFAGLSAADLDAILSEARSVRSQEQCGIRAGRGSPFLLLAAARPCPRHQDHAGRRADRGALCRHPARPSVSPKRSACSAIRPLRPRSTTASCWPGRPEPGRGWSRNSRRSPPTRCRRLAHRLQETHTRVVEMSTQQVEQRIAHALLRLVKQSGRKVEHGLEIDFPISRQDIAQMTGTTLHTGEPHLERLGKQRAWSKAGGQKDRRSGAAQAVHAGRRRSGS